MRWLSTIAEVDADRVVVERMQLDDSGFPHGGPVIRGGQPTVPEPTLVVLVVQPGDELYPYS